MPEEISFGGSQRLAIKKMVGGVRDIQALGADPKPIAWSGIFMPTEDGQSALDRARLLEAMRDAGLPVALELDEIYKLVYIRDFDPDLRFGRIPYRIALEVLKDLAAPVSDDTAPDADDLINGDLDAANGLADSIGDSGLSGLMANVTSAVGQVRSFVGASLSTIASVLQPINAAVRSVSSLIATTDSVLASVGVPAGVLPSVPLAGNIARFTAQLNATAMQLPLVQLQGVLGRMSTNLAQINSSGRSITVGGGNLFDIASKEYGDATGWTQIAQANNITDPELPGITTLIIPPYSSGAGGGVLSA
ncbi:LysM peptidoglycan-binding domain-containing protein [Cupriavidus basilensis]|uniref:LysM peptidoglycan-binding domain-containing protein n=1 Tax=Cupriavidus basilensis TaxID=68895 RepID=UPI001F31D05A|nr:hypothetical protein [Cupriavidus basilensis]